MIKTYCDKCKEELKEPTDIKDAFSCQVNVRSVKQQSFLTGKEPQIRPRMVEQYFHFCKKCWDESELCKE